MGLAVWQHQVGGAPPFAQPTGIGELEVQLNQLVNVVAGMQDQCDRLLEARRAAVDRRAAERLLPEVRGDTPPQPLMPEVVWAGQADGLFEVVDHRHVVASRLQAMREQFKIVSPTAWPARRLARLPQ